MLEVAGLAHLIVEDDLGPKTDLEDVDHEHLSFCRPAFRGKQGSTWYRQRTADFAAVCSEVKLRSQESPPP